MSEAAEPERDYCTRCGEFDDGKQRWMFYSHGISKEFYCWRCLRIMRIYAWIGFSLLFLLVGALTGAVIWLSR